MRKAFIVFFFTLFPIVSFSNSEPKDNTKEITMSATQAMQIAGNLVTTGDYETAEMILTKTPIMNSAELEIERWFLMGQIAQKRGDIDGAIKIYRNILDSQPNLARVRFELALCYMKQERWHRADHHMRLAMAGQDLSPDIKQMMNYYRYLIRKNKRWNIWFNFGAAPDNNINNAAGGQECISTVFGMFCRDLAEPVSSVGYNLSLGGNYEFVLSDHWRWKSDAALYTNIYDVHNYDDFYVSAASGPRYVWTRGDVWLAGIGARRLNGWHGYNWSYGAKADLNYDFTRRLSGGLGLRFLENHYDKYGPILNGETYSSNLRISWTFSANMYTILRTSLLRETTLNPAYSYWQPGVAVGLGAELPWGFHAYVEPSFYWSRYDAQQWVAGKYFTANDFMQRYALSLSNNKIDVLGFVPTVVFSYTRRNSNIWQREYDKFTVEFTMQQRF